MLEAKNLVKVYKTKGGEVRALDGVNIVFPETGMVFLLGKSGSGKSTLLNVCGGLDAPTEGEVIVKGRSSQDFSGSDFDSYRNTFVGFIFQEYNILNEFTVFDNIALALELQGKKKDANEIIELLDKVDLKDFAKRKPNTLSGGQKQRIAIARALVKNPEIIMADEPTGALDSATGKQIFDTLKKLSKEKLVIVVSHDREFAEQYGDRIIELKDGKIISDVTKTEKEGNPISENVSLIGNTVNIKSAKDLTEEEYAFILNYLKGADGDVVITNGQKEVQDFRKATRISDDLKQESFEETVEQPKIREYTKQESRFIRSRLPMRHAFKIGTSSLKYKPIRLLMTILLSSISFVMFGLLSTLMLYQKEEAIRTTLISSGYDTIPINQYYVQVENYGNESYTYKMQTKMSDGDLDKLSDYFGKEVFGAMTTSSKINNMLSLDSKYYLDTIMHYAYLPKDSAYRTNPNFIIEGTYPVQDEVLISSYTAETILEKGLFIDGSSRKFESASQLLGQQIVLQGRTFYISGIFQSEKISPRYDYLKDTEDVSFLDQYAYQMYLEDGKQLLAFFSEEALDDISASFSYEDYAVKKAFTGSYYCDYNYVKMPFTSLQKAKDCFLLEEKEDGILIEFNSWLREMMEKSLIPKEERSAFEENCTLLQMGYRTLPNGRISYLSKDERKALVKTIIESVKQEIPTTILIENKMYESKIVGFYFNDTAKNSDYNSGIIVLNDELYKAMELEAKNKGTGTAYFYTKYTPDPTHIYSVAYVEYDRSARMTDKVFEFEEKENELCFALGGSIASTFNSINVFVEMGSEIFFWVGIVLAAFSILLLANFISISISNKKREIGILRAVGARSADVFRIFFSESFFISFICFVISAVGTYFVCNYLNVQLAGSIGIAIFTLGWKSLLIMLGIATATAVVATYLPVNKAARKKPVESIRAI